MYEAEDDPYCYPGTTVLKNLLGLTKQADLDAFEAEITDQRSREPLPAGRLSFTHYRAIHHHLFQDVYAWAGKLRTVRIAKSGSSFCYPEYIKAEMAKLFATLVNQRHFQGLDKGAFAANATHFLAELNAIHPFREGNGRAQLSFLVILAERAGHPLNLKRLDPKEILAATVKSFSGNEGPLLAVLRKLIP